MNSTNQKCSSCAKKIFKKEFLKCITCKEVYDLECANVSHRNFSLKDRKEPWEYPDCSNRGLKVGNTNTPTFTTESENITHRARITRVNSPSISQKGPDYNMIEELKVYMADLIRNSMESVREAISDLTSTIRDQNIRIEQLESRVLLLENKKEQSCDIAALESAIEQLKGDISDQDQRMLLNDVEVAGCPETPTENCVHLILSIAKKIGIDLNEKDIVSAHRAGPNRSTSATSVSSGGRARPRPLVVRLARRALRDEMLRAARVRRNLTTEGLNLPGQTNSIYINERLTKHNRLIFYKARSLAREHQYKYIWTRDGKIFVCQAQGKSRHHLRTEEDVHRVFGKNRVES